MQLHAKQRLAHLDGLDGLRGLAVCGVMVGHLRHPHLAVAGDVGVTVFFVLSGYLITTLLVREIELTGQVDLRAFFGRRVRRLAPAFAVVVAVAVALTVVSGVAFVTPLEVVAAVLYSTNLMGWIDPERLGLLHHTWSLATEEQFYLVWPLVVVLLGTGRRVRLALWMLLIAVTLWRLHLLLSGAPVHRVAFAPDTRADGLLAGCLLALALARGRTIAGSAGPALVGLAALSLAPTVVVHLFGMPLVILFAAVVIQAVRLGRGPSWLAWKPLTGLGRISYGVYLWNPFTVLAADRLLGEDASALLVALVTIPLSIALAALSWRLVERRWLNPGSNGSVAGTQQRVVVVGLDDAPAEVVGQRIAQ